MSFLVLENVHIHYGPIEAVKGISLHVEKGEIVALLGANGAGKSTLMRAISGLVPLSQGKIVYEERDLASTPAYDRPRLGIAHVPEGRHVFAPLTVEENLILGAYIERERAKIRIALERVYDLFPRLKERRHQLAGTLSGGEQQMLAIGRALMSSPKLLLLDEPSLGLAPLIVKHIFELIRDIHAQGVTVFLVEQNARMALKTARRAYIIETGRLIMEGEARMLRHDTRVQEAYLGMNRTTHT
ncbi:MAG: Branched-chain amino acid transport ATP-binding protein LivF [Candidatus Carbobacillus altaicus]|uniref:Branched-chain amino acid transport ATP-binding protein LivF n=1 Tax=Candidatus Carbonibacillus altaicus TaxID=2163959 RepID=A0A2R6XY70_9BACL|nr:MAG: Branched-chain amino acid transport ATP-binding protein LivF [Candidatus Carbobacillus altaicus]